MIWGYVMILTKPFGQVQRHLKENAKFVFALYIPSLFKKNWRSHYSNCLLPVKYGRNVILMHSWNITINRLFSDLSTYLCSVVEICILNELCTINNNFPQNVADFPKVNDGSMFQPHTVFNSPKLICTICEHVFT